MTNLFLRVNQLSGGIPVELGNLSNLTQLELSQTQLSGSIPVELGNLSNLTNLFLNNNQLSGPLPQSLTDLSLTWFCVLVNVISNNCQIWHDGGMDQHFLNESSNGPYQRLDVPALSPMRSPGVSDSCSQMCSKCHCPIQKCERFLNLGVGAIITAMWKSGHMAIILSVLILVIAGCSEPAPKPEPTPAPALAVAPTETPTLTPVPTVTATPTVNGRTVQRYVKFHKDVESS